MDLRIERTKRSIINAFIELRAKKPLEKITVKELAELALINKATFYSHYSDIYDLSEQLEQDLITTILTDIPHPDFLISNPKQAVKELTSAMLTHNTLINTLFSDSRASLLVGRLENGLKCKIYETYPEYKNNLEWDVLITILIQGSFYAFSSHIANSNTDTLINIIGHINDSLISSYIKRK